MRLLCVYNVDAFDWELLRESGRTGVKEVCNEEAVTIYGGYALCKRHYTERIIRLEACNKEIRKRQKRGSLLRRIFG